MAISPGMWAASRIWNRLGVISSVKILEGTDSGKLSWLPSEDSFVFLTSRTIRR